MTWRLSYCNLGRGGSKTFLWHWEPLAVIIKKAILVPTGVLDPLLLEIETGILNKHQISGSEFSK